MSRVFQSNGLPSVVAFPAATPMVHSPSEFSFPDVSANKPTQEKPSRRTNVPDTLFKFIGALLLLLRVTNARVINNNGSNSPQLAAAFKKVTHPFSPPYS